MKNTTLFLFLLVVISTLFIAGCTQQAAQPAAQPTPQTTAMPTAAMSADTVKIADTSMGRILVDSQGKTLYYFASDMPASGASACTVKCATIWPAFSVDSVRVSSPLDPADFSSITRADGSRQTTYYGWPLYYYQADVNPGDVKGENVLQTWFVIKPDESVLVSHSTALGSYLTDTNGKTLYYFAKDAPGTASCTGTCLAKWPAFNTGSVSTPSILNPTDFSVAQRTDGVTQTAYMGRMLYYFADDAKPGDAKGQGFNNLWYVANITGYAPPVPTPTPTPVPTTVPTMSYSDSSSGGGGGGGGY